MPRERSCKRFKQDFSAGGRTKQSFGPQCDVNTIVERARVSGMVSHLNAKKPVYMDCSLIPDYQNALSIVNTAISEFAGLSSKVRERFSNDPANMIAFLSDDGNRDEAVKLGLMKAPVKGPDSPAKPGDPAPKA